MVSFKYTFAPIKYSPVFASLIYPLIVYLVDGWALVKKPKRNKFIKNNDNCLNIDILEKCKLYKREKSFFILVA